MKVRKKREINIKRKQETGNGKGEKVEWAA